ncbi:MAG: rRNA pseudouridine synthase [Chthoniobacterales bacterium]|nr:rRNA pseudouridine synthase [Chthoniobacterales bacterium]
MRLNRFLAAAGLGSRRSCEELIASGAVMLNGRRVDKLATVVADGDDVRVHGRILRVARPLHVLFHKPRGFVVTKSDERGRRTIYDLLPPEFSTLFHVGRLDKDSEGLLLLTNDGDLAQKLTHPSHGIEKEYEVVLDKAFDPIHSAKLLKGIFLEGGRGRFERISQLGPDRVRVVLRQGIKRQIRLMFYNMGYEVERLKRIRIGPVDDRGLPPGRFRMISPRELQVLQATGSAPSKIRKPIRHKRPPGRKIPTRERAGAKSSA